MRWCHTACLQVTYQEAEFFTEAFENGTPFDVVPSYSNYKFDIAGNVDTAKLPVDDACTQVSSLCASELAS